MPQQFLTLAALSVLVALFAYDRFPAEPGHRGSHRSFLLVIAKDELRRATAAGS
jgi:hypothetical protein